MAAKAEGDAAYVVLISSRHRADLVLLGATTPEKIADYVPGHVIGREAVALLKQASAN